jgi:hypothetical protein
MYCTSVPRIEANVERMNESDVNEIIPHETRYEIGLSSALQSRDHRQFESVYPVDDLLSCQRQPFE